MTKTPAPCAPPPNTPDGSWHLVTSNGKPTNKWWKHNRWYGCACQSASPEEAALAGWRYHSPVAAPDEVEALRRVVQMAIDSPLTHISRLLVDAGIGEWESAHPSVNRWRLTPLGRRALGVEK